MGTAFSLQNFLGNAFGFEPVGCPSEFSGKRIGFEQTAFPLEFSGKRIGFEPVAAVQRIFWERNSFGDRCSGGRTYSRHEFKISREREGFSRGLKCALHVQRGQRLVLCKTSRRVVAPLLDTVTVCVQGTSGD